MLEINGYPIIYKPDNKHANRDGYMYEHTYIAEQKLGRELTDEEVVHHRDLDRSNSSPSNLIIFKTKADHSSFHAHGCNEQLLLELEDGTYIVSYLKKNICPICGGIKDRHAELCISCYKAQGAHNRKIDASKLPREELKNLIRTTSFVEIGKMYNVTDNAIRKWCDKENLPRTKKEINSYSDEEWAAL